MKSSSDVEKSNLEIDLEMHNLVGAKPKKEEGAYHRFCLALDEHVSIKTLMRMWGPRLEFFVRLMLVATFLDDSIRTMMEFPQLSTQIAQQGCLRWMVSGAPQLAQFFAAIFLGVGLLAELGGSLCLLFLTYPNAATLALIGWTIVQPVMFAQLSNFMMLAESLSLLGGLLMLRTHLVYDPFNVQIQLAGRILLPVTYLYYAGLFLFSALTLDETNSYAAFMSSLSEFVLDIFVLVGLVIGSTLIAFGLKSRLVALTLAILNLCFVMYRHPFFRYIWIENGEWKYDEDNMPLPHVSLGEDVTAFDFDAKEIYDLHKYYFFLGLSTSGALLLLTQLGPGEIAAESDEVILPAMTRALD